MQAGLHAYEILELPFCSTSTVFAGTTWISSSSMTDPGPWIAIRFVSPKPFAVMIIVLLFLSMVTSAIIGFPTMSVAVASGSRAILAWSRMTAIVVVSARAGDAPEARTKATASQRRDDITALSGRETRRPFRALMMKKASTPDRLRTVTVRV